MTMTRTVTWGEGLLIEALRSPRGLQSVVEVITGELGRSVGSRNTFAKLFNYDDPADMPEKDEWRAWLVLATLGLDAQEWGMADDIVPPALDPDTLRTRLTVRHQGLEPRTR